MPKNRLIWYLRIDNQKDLSDDMVTHIHNTFKNRFNINKNVRCVFASFTNFFTLKSCLYFCDKLLELYPEVQFEVYNNRENSRARRLNKGVRTRIYCVRK